MELTKVDNNPIVEDAVLIGDEISSDQFIHANTIPVLNNQLRTGCIIPVFSKDNECTISHTEFIDTTYEVTRQFFGNKQNEFYNLQYVSHTPLKGVFRRRWESLQKS